jgi:hypothetical protein
MPGKMPFFVAEHRRNGAYEPGGDADVHREECFSFLLRLPSEIRLLLMHELALAEILLESQTHDLGEVSPSLSLIDSAHLIMISSASIPSEW